MKKLMEISREDAKGRVDEYTYSDRDEWEGGMGKLPRRG